MIEQNLHLFENPNGKITIQKNLEQLKNMHIAWSNYLRIWLSKFKYYVRFLWRSGWNENTDKNVWNAPFLPAEVKKVTKALHFDVCSKAIDQNFDCGCDCYTILFGLGNNSTILMDLCTSNLSKKKKQWLILQVPTVWSQKIQLSTTPKLIYNHCIGELHDFLSHCHGWYVIK